MPAKRIVVLEKRKQCSPWAILLKKNLVCLINKTNFGTYDTKEMLVKRIVVSQQIT